jgi:hypothetical protein
VKLNNSKSIKQKSLFKVILISFFSLTALLILFFSILFILFLVYKDDISNKLLYSVNQKINGKVSFSDLSFIPFKQFPNASLKLSDLSLLESKDSSVNAGKLPVFNVREAYVSLNIIDLFSSHINASAITFEGGSLNIIVYPDSQTNLGKALKIESGTEKIAQDKFIVTDTSGSQTKTVTDTTSGLNLQIDNLEIIDLELSSENHLKKNKILLKITELESEFSYGQNQIICSINLDLKIDSLIKNAELLLSDQQISFESKLEVDTDSIYVKLEGGSFSVGEAAFLFNGIFDSKNQGYIDLSVIASDEDFSLFSIFLSEDGMKNLNSGDLFFEAAVKGKTFVEFPTIDMSFGLKNVDLINQITKREIKNLNLKGNFNSGKSDDWSNAKLVIDTLFADLPDGTVNLSGSVHNFKMPEVDINVFLSADVTGLEKVFKLGSISDLNGKIELTDRIKGKYLIEEKKFVSEINHAKLSLDNFGVKIPGTMVFDNVNGVIRRENDDIYFDSLSVISEDTDILINGEVQNLPYLFFNVEKNINANLDIKSSVFDLPNFLAFDPSIKRDFNHRILDVDVSVITRTTTSKATKFKSFPEIEFDIRKIHATAENFLPRLEINSGKFKVSENLLGFNMKFDNFKTDFLDGDFNFSGEYNSSKYQPFYIKAKTDFKTISPSILFYDESDTIPEFLKGKLSGSFFVELQFPVDSTILKFVNLKNGDLSYKFNQDTITIHSLNFNLNDLYFNEKYNQNELATLSAKVKLSVEKYLSKNLLLDDANLNFTVKDGVFNIKSNQVKFFGKNARGKARWILSPFAEIPSFQIEYDVDKFYAEEMLATFLEDTMVTGPLNLSMKVNSKGTDWNSIVNNMKGNINLSGKDLIFYGLDADKVIDKFKRSQSFNLVDLGAVVLAGPVGLAVTKGTDFARILVTNPGESSQITNLVSHWELNNGVFIIKDAAFTTNKNRIAANGLIDFSQDSLNLTIALLNKYGCSVFSQNIYGNLDSPALGKVKVVGTILAPVTNLVDDILGNDCVPFYNGSVNHPK